MFLRIIALTLTLTLGELLVSFMITKLPTDVWANAFTYCDHRSMNAAGRSCQRLNSCLKSNALWREVCKRECLLTWFERLHVRGNITRDCGIVWAPPGRFVPGLRFIYGEAANKYLADVSTPDEAVCSSFRDVFRCVASLPQCGHHIAHRCCPNGDHSGSIQHETSSAIRSACHSLFSLLVRLGDAYEQWLLKSGLLDMYLNMHPTLLPLPSTPHLIALTAASLLFAGHGDLISPTRYSRPRRVPEEPFRADVFGAATVYNQRYFGRIMHPDPGPQDIGPGIRGVPWVIHGGHHALFVCSSNTMDNGVAPGSVGLFSSGRTVAAFPNVETCVFQWVRDVCFTLRFDLCLELNTISRFPRHGSPTLHGVSVCTTQDVEIVASPLLLPTSPSLRCFAYRMRMRLLASSPFRSVQLSRRHWDVTDDFTRKTDVVEGDGVIGEYPLLQRLTNAEERSTDPSHGVSNCELLPATCSKLFFYASQTSFKSVMGGTMRGYFTFVPGSLDAPEGPPFDVTVAPFTCKYDAETKRLYGEW